MTPKNDGLQVRYVELRFDGKNVIEGTLMRYGDTATLPWNEKERCEAGAFGNDVASQDLSLNIQHMRDQKIARTGGSGLTFVDSVSSLELRAELDIEDPGRATCVKQSQKGDNTRVVNRIHAVERTAGRYAINRLHNRN